MIAKLTYGTKTAEVKVPKQLRLMYNLVNTTPVEIEQLSTRGFQAWKEAHKYVREWFIYKGMETFGTDFDDVEFFQQKNYLTVADLIKENV